MAKLSHLVLRTSEVTGISLPTVREVSRRLRESGLIRTGKGGRYGGADMTPNDAARLLTALLIVRGSAGSMADIVSHTKTYLILPSHGARDNRFVLARWSRQLGLPELCELKPGHTFESAFTALIGSFSNGQFERRMEEWGSGSAHVALETLPDPEVRITITGDLIWTLLFVRRVAAKYITPKIPTRWSYIYEGNRFDLSVRSEISQETLKSIGLLLQKSETTHG
jgi:hypothetical protein